MNQAISDLAALLSTMEPKLHEGTLVYCTVPLGSDTANLSPIEQSQLAISTLEALQQESVAKSLPDNH